MEEWIIRSHCYMLRCGMSTLMKSKSMLRVGILWKLLVMMGRGLFGKW